MKKVLICLSALFLMAGCDNGTDTLRCTSTNTANGLTSDTIYDIKYKDDVVEHVTITYHYTQDDTANDTGDIDTGNTTRTTDTDNNDTDTDNTIGDNNDTTDQATARNGQNTTTSNDDVDGINADTDGISEEADNNTVDGDDVVDGIIGDAIDTTINGVTGTILDIAGIRNTYQNQMNTYDNIDGFTYKVDTDTDDEYKIIYEIDFDKINDSDLTRFNVDRDFTTLRSNYEDLGYTCK